MKTWLWNRLPDMLRKRNDHMCGMAFGKLFVVGGEIKENPLIILKTEAVDVLVLKTLKWKKGPGRCLLQYSWSNLFLRIFLLLSSPHWQIRPRVGHPFREQLTNRWDQKPVHPGAGRRPQVEDAQREAEASEDEVVGYTNDL